MGNGTLNLLVGGHESLPPSQGPWCLSIQSYTTLVHPTIVWEVFEALVVNCRYLLRRVRFYPIYISKSRSFVKSIGQLPIFSLANIQLNGFHIGTNCLKIYMKIYYKLFLSTKSWISEKKRHVQNFKFEELISLAWARYGMVTQTWDSRTPCHPSIQIVTSELNQMKCFKLQN
jgi:hypothetical protein